MSERKSIIKDKSFLFTKRIIKLYKYLTDSKKAFVLSKQMLRSGTAIGALVREAQNAESRMDFVHKLAIAQKEYDETIYWLELLFETDYLSEKEFKSIQKEADELLRMIRSSIITTKKVKKKPTHNS
ncbi:MAG: four helix bundle protein [Ferruginibacter sp.]